MKIALTSETKATERATARNVFKKRRKLHVTHEHANDAVFSDSWVLRNNWSQDSAARLSDSIGRDIARLLAISDMILARQIIDFWTGFPDAGEKPLHDLFDFHGPISWYRSAAYCQRFPTSISFRINAIESHRGSLQNSSWCRNARGYFR